MTLKDDYKKTPQQRLEDTQKWFAENVANTPEREVRFRKDEDTAGRVLPGEYGTHPIEKPYFDVPDAKTELQKATPDRLKDAVSQNPEAPFYTTLYKTLYPEPQDPKHQNAVKTLSTLGDIGLLIGDMITASKGGDVNRRNSVLGENNKYLQNEYNRIAQQKNIYRQGLLNAAMADRKEALSAEAARQAAQNELQKLNMNFQFRMAELKAKGATQKEIEELKAEKRLKEKAIDASIKKYGIDANNARAREIARLNENGRNNRFQIRYGNGGNESSKNKTTLYLGPENTVSYDKKNRLAVAAQLQNLLSEYKARGLFKDIRDLDITGLETEPVATQEMYVQEFAKRLYEESRNNPELKNELESILESLTDYQGSNDILDGTSYYGALVNPLNPKTWQDYIKTPSERMFNNNPNRDIDNDEEFNMYITD